MRILYIDIDSLRADHLGCYGYHRDTSPNIDKLAAEGVRFDNCYVSDAPCMPSRTALWSGRCGFHTGVVNHGGTAGQPFIEGPTRSFVDTFCLTNWMFALRLVGYKTATVSPFGERHGAWHWYAGYNEAYNPGRFGMERADHISPIALDWLQRNAREDNWFLHVNYWDPHTPYRTPADFGNPFVNAPLPDWLTEEVRQRGWDGYGPHSAQEHLGWGGEDYEIGFKAAYGLKAYTQEDDFSSENLRGSVYYRQDKLLGAGDFYVNYTYANHRVDGEPYVYYNTLCPTYFWKHKENLTGIYRIRIRDIRYFDGATIWVDGVESPPLDRWKRSIYHNSRTGMRRKQYASRQGTSRAENSGCRRLVAVSVFLQWPELSIYPEGRSEPWRQRRFVSHPGTM